MTSMVSFVNRPAEAPVKTAKELEEEKKQVITPPPPPPITGLLGTGGGIGKWENFCTFLLTDCRMFTLFPQSALKKIEEKNAKAAEVMLKKKEKADQLRL